MSLRVVIIGNGIAGVTAARFLRKAGDAHITIVSAETTYHFARTALMYAYMGHLNRHDLKPYEDFFWPKNDFNLRQEYAARIDTEAGEVQLASGERLGYDRLVLATGSRPVRYDWPGQHLGGVQGLYTMQDLDTMEQSTRNIERAVVVGGGLIGIELAEMLRSRHIEVAFLVRESAYMDFAFSADESAMIHREIEAHGVDLRLETELERIEDDGSGRVAAVHTSTGDRIDCGFVGIATGVGPRVELAEASDIETDRGILVERDFSTSAPGVYAAGDCAQFRTPLAHGGQIEQLWYSARRQGKTLGRILAGESIEYEEPVFFNSAKFFDLEYQTYGRVPPETDGTLAWMNEAGDRAVRMAVDDDGSVRGVNGFGVRLDHARWASAIRKREHVDRVLGSIGDFLFNPEFDSRIGRDIRHTLESGHNSEPGSAP